MHQILITMFVRLSPHFSSMNNYLSGQCRCSPCNEMVITELSQWEPRAAQDLAVPKPCLCLCEQRCGASSQSDTNFALCWMPGAVPGPWSGARLTMLTTACPFRQQGVPCISRWKCPSMRISEHLSRVLIKFSWSRKKFSSPACSIPSLCTSNWFILGCILMKVVFC